MTRDSSSPSPNPPTVLTRADLFDHIGRVMTQRGYAGDPTPAQLIYVVVTSRYLDGPLSAALKAQSAAGKNRLVQAATDLHPVDAVHEITASSQKAFIYSETDLRHRVLLYTEADSLPDDGAAASALRGLVSDGRLSYEVSEQDEKGKWGPRRIEKDGPISLITTSTDHVAYQLGTRLLEIPVDESPAQTREIMRRKALAASGLDRGDAAAELKRELVEAQEWLGCQGNRKIVVPFAPALAELLPARDVRMRRDFDQLLTVIKTIAFLHQCQRQVASTGAVIASLDDYRIARELLLPVFEPLQMQGLTSAVRRAVEAVGDDEITLSELADRTGVQSPAASETLERAVAGDWLRNLETRHGRKARIVRGERQLPDGESSLPSLERLAKLVMGEEFGKFSETPLPGKQESAA